MRKKKKYKNTLVDNLHVTIVREKLCPTIRNEETFFASAGNNVKIPHLI